VALDKALLWHPFCLFFKRKDISTKCVCSNKAEAIVKDKESDEYRDLKLFFKGYYLTFSAFESKVPEHGVLTSFYYVCAEEIFSCGRQGR
jgi:hypothetical protein